MTENTPLTCPRNEQAVGWALHSLEPDEEMAVLHHLPECPSCRQVAGDAEEVLSHLGAAVEQVAPPPALRDRLMARVAETPQQPRALRAAASPPPSPRPTEAPAVPTRRDTGLGRTRPADNRPRRGAGWTRRGRRLVAGALALVAVLAIGGLAVRNAQLEAQRDAQIAQAQNLENLIDQFGRPGVEHALLARDDGTTIAAVVVENGRQQVFPIGMPANAVDRDTYVLWGIADGANPEPLGTFDVTGNDERPLSVGSAPGSSSYAAYAISLEPGRTAPAVPTEVVAKGVVAA
jgi:anti-sigma-K factor RskA